jgi:hypothetical protein
VVLRPNLWVKRVVKSSARVQQTGAGTFMGGPENRTPDVLNKVQKFKGYVYENVTWSQDGQSLEVHVRGKR